VHLEVAVQSTASHHVVVDTDHALAAATVTLGAIALILLAVSHEAAAWTGLVVVFVGLWSQLVSRTRPERFENVIGATAGAMALAIGLSQGGLI
jgi:heme O synthase-like polyprenyltransferase